jgi:hypothetical protein
MQGRKEERVMKEGKELLGLECGIAEEEEVGKDAATFHGSGNLEVPISSNHATWIIYISIPSYK